MREDGVEPKHSNNYYFTFSKQQVNGKIFMNNIIIREKSRQIFAHNHSTECKVLWYDPIWRVEIVINENSFICDF